MNKSEKEIIDELGEWICKDMEKEMVEEFNRNGMPPTTYTEKFAVIKDVAKRIKFYRDNCIFS